MVSFAQKGTGVSPEQYGYDTRFDLDVLSQQRQTASKQDDRESRLNQHQISAFDNPPASPGLQHYDQVAPSPRLPGAQAGVRSAGKQRE